MKEQKTYRADDAAMLCDVSKTKMVQWCIIGVVRASRDKENHVWRIKILHLRQFMKAYLKKDLDERIAEVVGQECPPE